MQPGLQSGLLGAALTDPLWLHSKEPSVSAVECAGSYGGRRSPGGQEEACQACEGPSLEPEGPKSQPRGLCCHRGPFYRSFLPGGGARTH